MPRRAKPTMSVCNSATARGSIAENGSSNKTNRGSTASKRAISTRRFSPPESASAGFCARCKTPISSSSAAAFVAAARPRKPRISSAACTFSSALICVKTALSCGKYDSPRRARKYSGSEVTSSPSKRTTPASARNTPASKPKQVVLPAPFGPNRPTICPLCARNETPSNAARSRR